MMRLLATTLLPVAIGTLHGCAKHRDVLADASPQSLVPTNAPPSTASGALDPAASARPTPAEAPSTVQEDGGHPPAETEAEIVVEGEFRTNGCAVLPAKPETHLGYERARWEFAFQRVSTTPSRPWPPRLPNGYAYTANVVAPPGLVRAFGSCAVIASLNAKGDILMLEVFEPGCSVNNLCREGFPDGIEFTTRLLRAPARFRLRRWRSIDPPRPRR